MKALMKVDKKSSSPK